MNNRKTLYFILTTLIFLVIVSGCQKHPKDIAEIQLTDGAKEKIIKVCNSWTVGLTCERLFGDLNNLELFLYSYYFDWEYVATEVPFQKVNEDLLWLFGKTVDLSMLPQKEMIYTKEEKLVIDYSLKEVQLSQEEAKMVFEDSLEENMVLKKGEDGYTVKVALGGGEVDYCTYEAWLQPSDNEEGFMIEEVKLVRQQVTLQEVIDFLNK